MLQVAYNIFQSKIRKQGSITYSDKYKIAGILSLFGLPLARLMSLFGTDKNLLGGHAYAASYERALKRFRFKHVKVLEIGVLNGFSLLTWRSYFPFATTIGVDIVPKQHMTGARTRVYSVDQSDSASLQALAKDEGPFDIIIDDGSHQCAHQLLSFETLFESLSDGGIYVIEDVQTSFWHQPMRNIYYGGRHINDVKFHRTTYGYFLEQAKYLNHAEFQTLEDTDARRMTLGRQITRIEFEHNLIIIWKGWNDLASNQNLRDVGES